MQLDQPQPQPDCVDDLCPECQKCCPVLEHDKHFGDIYECYRCKVTITLPDGLIACHDTPYRWIYSYGEKVQLVL